MTSLDRQVWLLLHRASCAACRGPLSPHPAGTARRFYACHCHHLHDADLVERRVIAAAALHQATLNEGLVRPYAINRCWARLDPYELLDILRGLIRHVHVDPTPGTALDIQWLVTATTIHASARRPRAADHP